MTPQAPLRFLLEVTGQHKLRPSDPPRVFRFSTHPFTTTPADSPADTPYYSDLTQATDASRNMWAPGTTQGQSRRSFSNARIRNGNRRWDVLFDYAFDLRTAVVRCGPVTATLLSEHTAQTLVIDRQPTATLDAIEFVLRDNAQRLSKPLQQNKYAGTNVLPNGVEGTNSDIGGKEKSWIFGQVKEWPVVFVNTAKLIGQVHDGALDYWPACYDKGIPLTFAGFYASQAELENDALQPAAGHFKVWLAGGMCRLGSSPVGVVTADVTVGASPADRTAAKGMEAVWLKAGYDPSEILASDLTALDAANSAEIAFGVNDATIGEAVCDQIAATIGGWWGVNLAGLLRVQQVGKIEGTAVATFTEHSSPKRSLQLESTADPERGTPLKALTLQYARNYTTQTDPAAGVSDARRAYVAQQYRQVVVENAAVATTYLNAAAPTRQSLFVYEADALAEATRVLQFRSVERFRFTITVFYSRAFAATDLGDLVGLNFPAFGLPLYGNQEGRLFRVLGIAPNTGAVPATITFNLWGNTLLDRNLSTEDDFLLQAEDGSFLIAEAA